MKYFSCVLSLFLLVLFSNVAIASDNLGGYDISNKKYNSNYRDYERISPETEFQSYLLGKHPIIGAD